MIETMKFLSITGPKSDIDRVVNEYLAKYEIHLENAMAQLTQVQHLSPYIQINPYKEILNKATEFAGLLQDTEDVPIRDISLDEATDLIDSLSQKLSDINAECDDLKAKRTAVVEDLNRITPFLNLPEDVDKLVHYRFVQVRFGRIAKEYYNKFKEYVYDDLDTWFYPCHEDEYVWGVYFVPWTKMEEVDAVFSSMHFERIYLKKDYYHGTPQAIHRELKIKLETIDKHMASCQEEIRLLLRGDASAILSAKEALSALSTNFDVRKVAACVREHQETFYILCGWMTEKDALAFQKDIENDAKLFCIIEDDQNNIRTQPPTKLRNPKVFKPFEMYVKMYGLPAYNEMDPTMFVAITYSFIFGAMFGDVGQGLLLAIGGAVGFGSGLTGVGGPVLSVPLMVILGFSPLTAIATSQVIQITAALSGSAGNLAHGFIDADAAVWVTAAELVGVTVGARLAHSISQASLKKVVSVVCIVVGAFIILRACI